MITRRWPNGTIACLAPGPSLTLADCERVRGKVDGIIAINDAVRLAPWADILYSSDPGWWKRNHKDAPTYAVTFAGQKVAIECDRQDKRNNYPWPDVTVLKNTGVTGFETNPKGLKNYQNSGGAAINLAVHLGASKILLLGYDMAQGPNGKKYFHEERRPGSPYAEFRKHIATMVPALMALNVAVINCSRQTKLACFPRMPLEQALSIEVAA